MGSRSAPMAIPEELVKPWKLPEQKMYVFENASIVEPANGTLLQGRSVQLAGGLIQSIEASTPMADEAEAASPIPIFSTTKTIDLTGKFLCPGLIDCHVHISAVPGSASLDDTLTSDAAVSLLHQPFVCGQMLARGFTTVRDCGGATPALMEALDEEVFPGPRLFLSNRAVSRTGGFAYGQGVFCGGRNHSILSAVCHWGDEHARRAARDQMVLADFLSLMLDGNKAQFTAAEIRDICRIAKSHGASVTAHAADTEAIRHAVENGVMGIEHGGYFDLEGAKLMAERGVCLTPTLVLYHSMVDEKYDALVPPEARLFCEHYMPLAFRLLRVADYAGVKMCYGSDLLGPMMAEQSHEFTLRRQELSNMKVLQHATVNGAEMLQMANFLGQVKPGFAADLLVLDENPLEDVTILDRPEEHILAVIKNGRVYSSRWDQLPVDAPEARLVPRA